MVPLVYRDNDFLKINLDKRKRRLDHDRNCEEDVVRGRVWSEAHVISQSKIQRRLDPTGGDADC